MRYCLDYSLNINKNVSLQTVFSTSRPSYPSNSSHLASVFHPSLLNPVLFSSAPNSLQSQFINKEVAIIASSPLYAYVLKKSARQLIRTISSTVKILLLSSLRRNWKHQTSSTIGELGHFHQAVFTSRQVIVNTHCHRTTDNKSLGCHSFAVAHGWLQHSLRNGIESASKQILASVINGQPIVL